MGGPGRVSGVGGPAGGRGPGVLGAGGRGGGDGGPPGGSGCPGSTIIIPFSEI